MSAQPQLIQEYRPHRSQFLVGLVTLALTVGAGIALVWGVLAYPDADMENPLQWAIGIGAVASFIAFWVALELRFAVVGRCQIFDDRICLLGVFQSREIKFDDVVSADWRMWDSLIILRATSYRLRVNLTRYGRDAGNQIRIAIRSAIPQNAQWNWVGEHRLDAMSRQTRRDIPLYLPGMIACLAVLVLPKDFLTLRISLTVAGIVLVLGAGIFLIYSRRFANRPVESS